MRTQEEIAAKATALGSLLGFGREVLVLFLDFEHAKPFLKPETTSDDWKPTKLSREAILGEMREYMEFAWGKVEDHRGISASRSVEKMEAWIWLLGDEQVIFDFESADYTNYGAPKLAVVCRAYEFPIPESSSVQNMIAGNPCSADYRCGCGE